MEIQWSLVLFTALTGAAGWMFACVAVDEFLCRAKTSALPASIGAFILAVVGGLASVTHLSHPENILGALSHPTSGIFVEAVLVGCFCLFVALYALLIKRKASAGACKAIAVIAAVLGIALSFMAGESYLMEARTNWNTQLLPLGYMLTAAPVGVAAYLAVVATRQKDADLKPYVMALIASGALAAVGAVLYVFAAGALGEAALLLVGCVVCAGVVPIVCGVMLQTQADKLLALSALSAVAALAGAVMYRCIMWMITVPIVDIFGIVI